LAPINQCDYRLATGCDRLNSWGFCKGCKDAIRRTGKNGKKRKHWLVTVLLLLERGLGE
jgi:hypothetical protein